MSANGITLDKFATTLADEKARVPSMDRYLSYCDPDGERMEQAFWAIKNGEDILLGGQTGVGKTHFAEALAAVLNAAYRRVACHEQTDATAFLGGWVHQGAAKGMKWNYGPIAGFMQHGGVCLIDEINQAHSDARIAIGSIHWTDGGVAIIPELDETIHRQPGSVVIATYNPYEYAGTKEFGAQLMSRYGVVIEVGYLPSRVERDLLMADVPGLSGDCAEAMIGAANTVRTANEDERVTFPMSYREIRTWGAASMQFGVKQAATIAVLNKVADPLERDGISELLAAHFGPGNGIVWE